MCLGDVTDEDVLDFGSSFWVDLSWVGCPGEGLQDLVGSFAVPVLDGSGKSGSAVW